MEKFSQWRDPATGINPFVPVRTSSSALSTLLLPVGLVLALLRGVLLAGVVLLHVILVEGLCALFKPVPALYRPLSSLFTAITCRLALGCLGYFWINAETASAKRGAQGVAQAVREPKKGDLIVSNWTSYVEVLYLAFRYNPTFLLPIFSPAPPSSTPLTGRHTGTGSAQLSTTLPQPPFLGYRPFTLFSMLRRTGCLPEVCSTPPVGMYKTLKEARRAEAGVVCLFPEGTTGNGRAVLRVSEGVLADGDVGSGEGVVWVKYAKHTNACPLPQPLPHLYSILSSFTSNSLLIRTLHPSASPSSPSFLPSDILSSISGGLEGVGRDGTGAWREAVMAVLAETGRTRRVRGMGWVEKGSFLEYARTGKKGR
ncbi:uncharacterized protein MKK02DRAFT_39348 [Dioszegia hungarica]|uniref:Phospholipid/glycerol acyltransferase domain-containing protein n=1 Tax=Dioszegia hungarica TaxID=4972 RepID=A0AA38LWT5_9TREE|nr:uncharacterized protein MKK02DRAFT_39348 [Dioszegia hungarica]KAI9639072.1 hypothetical protein MKK02DRAFT_39348 [Dioszegia hungarica]